jgi:hypothetical protein
MHQEESFMSKNEKCFIAVFCIILLVLSGFILIRYYHRVSNDYAVSESTEDLIPVSGYTYTTASGELTTSEHPEGISSRRTFTHKVYIQENQALAVISVTVSGNISDDSLTITHISTSLSEEVQDGLTVSEHISGETATVVLYVNQISVCHFQYRLSQDGSIDFL